MTFWFILPQFHQWFISFETTLKNTVLSSKEIGLKLEVNETHIYFRKSILQNPNKSSCNSILAKRFLAVNISNSIYAIWYPQYLFGIPIFLPTPN